jgi:hypothetical protein
MNCNVSRAGVLWPELELTHKDAALTQSEMRLWQ